MDNKKVELRKKWIKEMKEENLRREERIKSLKRDIEANDYWIKIREQEIQECGTG